MNTTNLERMRKVKTRHQRLYARVETVREELQRFLEDDDDMAKMCLTRKKELERMVSTGGGEAPRPSRAAGLPGAGSYCSCDAMGGHSTRSRRQAMSCCAGERHSFVMGSLQRRSMSINIHGTSSLSRGPSHQYSTPQVRHWHHRWE